MELLPFQKEAVKRMVSVLKVRGSVYNACEMGLGKSAMALETINLLPDVQNIVVICPAIVRLVWKDEIKKWGKNGGYLVLSYNEAVSKSYFISADIDCLILDESHYLKNSKAKRTEAVLKHLWPKAKYKICLSGTPMTKSVADCWTIFSRMAPEDFSDWWSFVQTYTHAKRGPYGWKFEGVKNAEALKSIIRKKFFIRYKKSDVLTELPDKIWQTIPLDKSYKVETTKEEDEAQEEYLKLLTDSYIRKLPIKTAPPIAVATMARKQGLKKASAVADFCKNLLDENQPVVIFLYHKDVVAEVAHQLKKYNPVVITGETDGRGRETAVKAFEAGETNCFIGNISASGVGITLIRSSLVVFGELSWSPAHIAQAADRCHRVGQTKTVNCYVFSVKDSIDERINDVLIRKSRAFSKVLE